VKVLLLPLQAPSNAQTANRDSSVFMIVPCSVWR
jgi:hypothetical protein